MSGATTKVFTLAGFSAQTINTAVSYAMAVHHSVRLKINDTITNSDIIAHEGESYLFADSDSGQTVTASTEPVEYEDNIDDALGSWINNTTYKSKRKEAVTFTPSISTTSAGVSTTILELEGVAVAIGVYKGAANTVTQALITLDMDVDEEVQVFLSLTQTRNTDGLKNFITAVGHGPNGS